MLKEVENDDILTNLMFKSRMDNEDNKLALLTDHKLNYNKVLNNPKSLEYTYVDAMANLDELNLQFRKRITEKNKHYNFFLDDSQDPHGSKPITKAQYDIYKSKLGLGIYAYTVRNTWTKGKEFYFVERGCLMKMVHIYDDLVFADVEYKGKVGLMKLEQLRVVLPDSEQ